MTGGTTLEADLTSINQQLLDALVQGDIGALTSLVAADCQIIGPKGLHITTQEWIDTHSAHVYQQVRLETLESQVRRHGDIAVRSDLQRSECLYQAEFITGVFRVLSVWVRALAGWQLAAIQYTAVTPAAQTSDAPVHPGIAVGGRRVAAGTVRHGGAK